MGSKSSLNFISFKALFVGLFAFVCFTKAEESFKTRPLLMPNVQPKVPETYLCTAFTMPKHDFQYIVGFTPNASMHTAHHILIYGCEIPGQWERDTPRLVWDCGEMSGVQSGYLRGPTCSAGSQIIYAWAKDAPPLKLPEGVGFRVGKNTGINYLVLQVHYAHVDKFLSGETDNSGIILSLLPSTSNQVTKTAGVYLLGTNGMIRAREEEHFEVACRINEPVVLHPFAFRTHTHALGRVVSGFKIDKNGKWHLIGKHNPQEPQMFYPVEDKDLTVEYGDVLAARCTMYNFRKKNTYIGYVYVAVEKGAVVGAPYVYVAVEKGAVVGAPPTGEDEMCNFYMMYYIDGDKPLTDKYCFSSGPNSYYWDRDLLVGYVPQEIDEGASQLEDSI